LWAARVDCDELFAIADTGRSGKQMAIDEIAFVRDFIPAELEPFPQFALREGPWPVRCLPEKADCLAGEELPENG
jgi:hypothetical protein